nr:hypothetical protein CR513_22134 [Ipomoea batatas]
MKRKKGMREKHIASDCEAQFLTGGGPKGLLPFHPWSCRKQGGREPVAVSACATGALGIVGTRRHFILGGAFLLRLLSAVIRSALGTQRLPWGTITVHHRFLAQVRIQPFQSVSHLRLGPPRKEAFFAFSHLSAQKGPKPIPGTVRASLGVLSSRTVIVMGRRSRASVAGSPVHQFARAWSLHPFVREAPLSRSYGVHFAEFLERVSRAPSISLTLPTCVGFGYRPWTHPSWTNLAEGNPLGFRGIWTHPICLRYSKPTFSLRFVHPCSRGGSSLRRNAPLTDVFYIPQLRQIALSPVHLRRRALVSAITHSFKGGASRQTSWLSLHPYLLLALSVSFRGLSLVDPGCFPLDDGSLSPIVPLADLDPCDFGRTYLVFRVCLDIG